MKFVHLRWAAPALACLALTAPAFGQDANIFGYTPNTITTGTVITITGSFAKQAGGAKPKVFGTMPDTKKKIAFKVLEHSDVEIVAEVKKIPTSKKAPAAGTDWTLNVLPKGKGAFTETTAMTPMTVLAPTIVSVNPSTGMPGEEITISIANVGIKTPKAKIGGKKTKLKPAPITLEEGGAITAYLAKVPKSLANGAWDVEVDNKLGSDTVEGALTVTGSNKKIGKAKVTYTVNGTTYTASGKFAQGDYDTMTGAFGFGASTGKNPTRSVNTGMTISGAIPEVVNPPAFAYTEVFANDPFNIASWLAVGGSLSLTITAISGGQVGGTFTGTVTGQQGQGTASMEGEFIVDV
jgi:hypothetical protein